MPLTRPSDPIARPSSTEIGDGRTAGHSDGSAAPSGSWMSKAIGVLVLLVFLVAAVFVVADTAGHNLATSKPDLALRVAPWNPTALGEQAQQEMRAGGNLGLAEDLARRALLSDPLDTGALSLLGAAAEREGDFARAETLMTLAAARSWRNSAPHFWLFAQAIRRGKFDEALAQADGLLRVSPNNSTIVFPILALLGLDPRGVTALQNALASKPPWRSLFLSQAVVKGSGDLLMTQLYQSLIRSGQPPTSLEMKPYLDRLIQMGRFEEAYESWRVTNSQAGPAARYPYNGNFDVPLDGSPFNWVFDFVSGAEVDLIKAPDGEGSHALRIQFSGARATLGRVGQLLMLPPASYQLEFAVKADDLRTDRGLVWQISCAESRSVLGETSPVRGTRPWTELKLDFSVPSSGCNAQWLKLILPARTASESEIEGEVWFQRFRITPEGAPTEPRATSTKSDPRGF